MNRIISIILLLVTGFSELFAVEKSFTISFGSENPSTNSLTNATFHTAVSGGSSYIAGVTSVVSVFPEKDAIRLSSNKTNGKFNIELSEDARIVAKKIVLRASRYENDRDADAMLMVNSEPVYIPSVSAEDYTIQIPSRPERTLTNLIVDAEHRVYLHSITVVYDSSTGDVEPEKEQVAKPVITPSGGRVSYGTNATITCPTEGATIHYTIDGSIPTSSAPVYTEPIALFNDLTIRAFAVKDDMNPSDLTEADFTVHNAGAEQVAEFDFTNPESLTPAIAIPAVKEWVELDGRTFTDGDVAVTFSATGNGNTSVRLYHSYDAGTAVRLYDGDCMTITSLNPNFVIAKAEFVTSLSGDNSDIDFYPSSGQYEWLTNTWTAADESVSEVTLSSLLQSRVASMIVILKNLSGIEAIEYDHDQQAVYYTLQGIRIGAGAPAPGLYIRISGRKAEKIVIR